MAPQGQEAPPRDARNNGRFAVVIRRIIRAQSRFRDIARSDGVGAALSKAGSRIRKKLGVYGRQLATRLGARRCPYFTPPRSLDPYQAWLRVNADNPRRRRRLDAARK